MEWGALPHPPLKMAAHALFLQLAYKFQQARRGGNLCCFEVCLMYILYIPVFLELEIYVFTFNVLQDYSL